MTLKCLRSQSSTSVPAKIQQIPDNHIGYSTRLAVTKTRMAWKEEASLNQKQRLLRFLPLTWPWIQMSLSVTNMIDGLDARTQKLFKQKNITSWSEWHTLRQKLTPIITFADNAIELYLKYFWLRFRSMLLLHGWGIVLLFSLQQAVLGIYVCSTRYPSCFAWL